MLPVVTKRVPPAPDSKWWKPGEDGGELWRAPLPVHTTPLSWASDPHRGARGKQDRAGIFCDIKAEAGWLITELFCFGLFWSFLFFTKILGFFF